VGGTLLDTSDVLRGVIGPQYAISIEFLRGPCSRKGRGKVEKRCVWEKRGARLQCGVECVVRSGWDVNEWRGHDG
jgi:hypothetical protein